MALIDECIAEYWAAAKSKEKLVVGADELLPIFSYCLVKANVEDVFCECAFIYDFIPDFLLTGREGYALVTLQV